MGGSFTCLGLSSFTWVHHLLECFFCSVRPRVRNGFYCRTLLLTGIGIVKIILGSQLPAISSVTSKVQHDEECKVKVKKTLIRALLTSTSFCASIASSAYHLLLPDISDKG